MCCHILVPVNEYIVYNFKVSGEGVDCGHHLRVPDLNPSPVKILFSLGVQ